MKVIKILTLCLIAFSTNAQLNKAALISVYGSRNLSDNPLETKMYEAMMKDSSFNLKPIVNKFALTINEKFLPQFPFPFLSKDEVVKAEGYKDLSNLTGWAKDPWYVTTAEQYIPISVFGTNDDSEAIKQSFNVVKNGVDGVMIAYLNFNIYTSAGVGPMAKKKIYAYVNIKIYNKEGKRIFKLTERATSDEGTLAVGGILTDIKKVMPLVESAANNLFKDMEEKLPKSLNKMAKQMDKYNKD